MKLLLVLLTCGIVHGRWILDVVGPPNEGAYNKYRSMLYGNRLQTRSERICDVYTLGCDAVAALLNEDLVPISTHVAAKPIKSAKHMSTSILSVMSRAFMPNSDLYPDINKHGSSLIPDVGSGTWKVSDQASVHVVTMFSSTSNTTVATTSHITSSTSSIIPTPTVVISTSNTTVATTSNTTVATTSNTTVATTSNATVATTSHTTSPTSSIVPTPTTVASTSNATVATKETASIVPLSRLPVSFRRSIGARYTSIGMIRYKREKPPMLLDAKLDKIMVHSAKKGVDVIPLLGPMPRGDIYVTTVMMARRGRSSSYRFITSSYEKNYNLVAIDTSEAFTNGLHIPDAMLATLLAVGKPQGDTITRLFEQVTVEECVHQSTSLGIIAPRYDNILEAMYEYWTEVVTQASAMLNPSVCITDNGVSINYRGAGKLPQATSNITTIHGDTYTRNGDLSCMPDAERHFTHVSTMDDNSMFKKYNVDNIVSMDGIFGYDHTTDHSVVAIGSKAGSYLGITGTRQEPSIEQSICIMAVDIDTTYIDKIVGCQAAAIYFNAPVCAYRYSNTEHQCVVIYGKVTTRLNGIRNNSTHLLGWKFSNDDGIIDIDTIPSMKKEGWKSYILLGDSRMNTCS
jgi:hypothetical protein